MNLALPGGWKRTGGVSRRWGMLTDRLRDWAGVGLLAVVGVAPLRAQEPSLPPLPSRPAPLTSGIADKKLPPALPEAPPVAAPAEPPAACHTEYHPAPARAPEHSRAARLYLDP